MKPLIYQSLFMGVLLSLLSACDAGSGEGLDANGQPVDGAQEIVENIDTSSASIENIQQIIFQPNCVECHNNTNRNGGLSLQDVATSYANLVNVASVYASSRPELFRVKPLDLAASHLYLKVSHDPNLVNNPMPLGRPRLPQEQIDLIEIWILAGAPGPQQSQEQP